MKKTKFIVDGVSIDGASKCRVEIATSTDGAVITVKPYKKKTAYWCRVSAIVNQVLREHVSRESVKETT